MATGAPKPAVPSRKAPKEKAISSACNLLSEVIEAIKCLMISNCPLLTVILNKKTAVTTIQQIGNKPYNAPFAVERSASFMGMPYTKMAMSIAIAIAIKLALYPLHFFYDQRPKNKKYRYHSNQGR